MFLIMWSVNRLVDEGTSGTLVGGRWKEAGLNTREALEATTTIGIDRTGVESLQVIAIS